MAIKQVYEVGGAGFIVVTAEDDRACKLDRGLHTAVAEIVARRGNPAATPALMALGQWVGDDDQKAGLLGVEQVMEHPTEGVLLKIAGAPDVRLTDEEVASVHAMFERIVYGR